MFPAMKSLANSQYALICLKIDGIEEMKEKSGQIYKNQEKGKCVRERRRKRGKKGSRTLPTLSLVSLPDSLEVILVEVELKMRTTSRNLRQVGL
jgi:hypothetical protein